MRVDGGDGIAANLTGDLYYPILKKYPKPKFEERLALFKKSGIKVVHGLSILNELMHAFATAAVHS